MKRKGFTLIELLAVIVILAVIAIIATPIVLNVVDNAQKQADLGSANGIVDAGRLYYSESLLDETKKENINKYRNLWNLIYIQGEKPKEGELYVNPSGAVALSVIYHERCYQKTFTSGIERLPKEECGLGFVGDDTTLPTVQFTPLDHPFNEFHWAKQDFYVQIEVIDAESGPASYKWCATQSDPCNPETESPNSMGTVFINQETSTNKICVIGIDQNQNESEVICSAPYKLDKTQPNLQGIGDMIIQKDETIDLLKEVVVEDNLSGIDGSFTYTPTSIDTSKSGVTEVTYTVKDFARNIKSVIRKIIIEGETPTVTFTPETGKINNNGWQRKIFS